MMQHAAKIPHTRVFCVVAFVVGYMGTFCVHSMVVNDSEWWLESGAALLARKESGCVHAALRAYQAARRIDSSCVRCELAFMRLLETRQDRTASNKYSLSHIVNVQMSTGLSVPAKWTESEDPYDVAKRTCQLMTRTVSPPVKCVKHIYQMVIETEIEAGNRLESLARPPFEVPTKLYHEFLMLGDGLSPVELRHHYVDQSLTSFYRVYSESDIDAMIQQALRRETSYYGRTDTYLYSALTATGCCRDKRVLVVGSMDPWYEAVAIAFGCENVTTVEYATLRYMHPRIQTFTVKEFELVKNANPNFDFVISISTFEHDGLGRYGDPISPAGDLDAMEKARSLLAPTGIMLLAIPVGVDALVWNVHRVYGHHRLPLLFRGWTLLAHFGPGSSSRMLSQRNEHLQPVFVLTPSNATDTNDYVEPLCPVSPMYTSFEFAHDTTTCVQ